MQQPKVVSEAYVVLCTAPDNATAQQLAEYVVNKQLAACVNILPQVQSVYRWQGEVQSDTEWLLVIKTSAAGYSKLEQAIAAQHPYDVPEIIALPISNGLPAYLSWLQTSIG
ncbi:MAG: divalent-cation tolerance protein CutA [Idiomarina sp.]|nr:divalent-cation tolerance protein CutA [Idiomarina sp.]